jgi:hypothetical protein
MLRRATILILGLCLSTVNLHGRAAAESHAPMTIEERSRLILELEHRVRAAREQLANLLSEARRPDTTPLRAQPLLRTVAAELSETNAELRRLRAGIFASPLPPARQ